MVPEDEWRAAVAAAEAAVTPFRLRVYALVRTVPPGRVTTYGAVARRLHSCARAVGGAMRRNPFPCSMMP